MKEISLNRVFKNCKNYKKYSALVDDEDYERVNKYNWSVVSNKTNKYVAKGRGNERIYMHKFILNCNQEIDHINRNGLDNRKSNLRIATHSQNMANTKARSNKKTSKYKGVYWDKKHNRWICEVTKDKKRVFSRTCRTERAAVLAYNEAMIKHYGEFAYLNVI